MILLISAQDTLVEAYTVMFPSSIPLVHVATVTRAESYLTSRAGDELEPALILLDAEAGYEAVAGCRHLYQDCLIGEPPLVALIGQMDERQWVLDAGADDYLLLPLQPAEVYSWLADYLFAAFRNFQPVLETVQQMSQTAVSRTLNRGLENLAQIFHAPSAWIFLLNPDKETFNLAGSYNPPPLIRQKNILSGDSLPECLELIRQDGTPQLMACSYLARAGHQKTNGLTHHLSLPLYNRRQFIGVLNLAYTTPPNILPADEHVLSLLSREIGVLMETARQQEETQFYATRTAFMVLLVRTIGEQSDLNTVMSLTLEQTVSMLGASGGDIWLLAADGQWLDQTSSLSSLFSNPIINYQLLRRPKEQGLLGWVAKHGRPLYTNAPADDPRFDPQVDQVETLAGRSLLAVPLRHREAVIGVMVVYYNRRQPFANRDTILLEGVANLTASAIANARLLQDLHEHTDRQQVLYEMSQQIAAGLDLPATLKRTLYWIGRLFEVEVSFLWLVKEATETLYLAAALGIDLPQRKPITLVMGQNLNGWVGHNGEAVIVNDLADDPRLDKTIFESLDIAPHNIMAAPIIYNNQTLGVVSLINKIGGVFDNNDLTLLSTAIEIIAVAVSNATLHAQTITLMAERERLQRQILQTERLATMGRLTATLSHEINNPMQAIQGALALALEELNSPQDLMTYLQLCQTESARVVQLLNHMRQIYRPGVAVPKSIDLNQTLQEAIILARKDLKRQKISLQTDLDANLPRLTGTADQLNLVFLSLLLNLGDAISVAIGSDASIGDAAFVGGELLICSYALPRAIRVEFSTGTLLPAAMDNWATTFTGVDSDLDDLLNLGLFMSQDIIVAHNGFIEIERQGSRTVCRIELPLDNPLREKQ